MTKTEEAIQKFAQKHGNKFDYSKVEYINAKTKIIVVCKLHGDFLITPNNHLSGYGCNKCSGRGFTAQEKLANFLQQAEKIHGNKYDYSKVDITAAKLLIICKIHGEFIQSKLNHITGKNGCPACANINRGLAKMLPVEKFIEKAKASHGDRYDYSLVNYLGAHKKVKIICKNHGIFEVTPANHWSNKVGCPSCFRTSSSKGEVTIRDWLVINKIEYECQKTFKDLFYLNSKSKLKYDFYLPTLNTLIEYDGEYHYNPISYGSSILPEDQLAITQSRDKIKTEYAERNDYVLLRIRYDDDIISVLEAKINKSSQRD